MNVLEKITKEIEERVHMVENIPTHGEDDFLDGEECYEDGRVQGRYEELVWCRGMIHSNMDDAADMNNGWIPVEERLPEDCEEIVLVQVSGKPAKNILFDNAFEFASYEKEEGWILDNYPEWENPDVIAWAALSEPYKPEEN